jgi:hypothetical protein
MTDPHTYYYLGGDALHTGLYVDLLERLAGEGIPVALIARLRVSPDPIATWRAWKRRDWLGPNRIERVRERVPAGVHRLPLWNLAPTLSLPRLEAIVGPPVPSRRVILHTRQVVMARLGLALRRKRPDVRVIAEIEGDDLAEVAYRARAAPLHRRWALRLEHAYYDAVDRRIVHESDAVLCVSQHLKDVLITRYALDPARAERITVMPTFASRAEFFFDPARRARVRRATGLETRFVVVYSGNLRAAWQVPDRVVQVFTLIRETRPDAFLLALTPDGDRIEPHLRAARIDSADYRIQSCPHDEILDHLCAADLGLLLRERHPMNQAAAPGKFGEYVLAGLPIVMTDGIGDFSDRMRDHPLACVLPDLRDIPDIQTRIRAFCSQPHGADAREAFSRWSGEHFTVEITVPMLAALYRSVS